MASQPSPPDSLPKYLAEGVSKQDDETLRDLREWIDDLLDYRQDIAADEIEVDDGEEMSTRGAAWTVQVRCETKRRRIGVGLSWAD